MIAANSMLMFSIHMGFVAFCYAANKEAIREYRFPRTVISSASEKSFSFAVKQCMRVNKNGKPDIPSMWDTVFHVNGSAELVRKRIATKIVGSLPMTIRGKLYKSQTLSLIPAFKLEVAASRPFLKAVSLRSATYCLCFCFTHSSLMGNFFFLIMGKTKATNFLRLIAFGLDMI